MDPNKKPRAREKYYTGAGKGVHKKGDGLGTGPAGSKDGYSGKGSGGGEGGSEERPRLRRGAGGGVAEQPEVVRGRPSASAPT